MNRCAITNTGKFFNTYARQYEKYFRKKGLHKEQKHLVEGIERSGIAQAGVLEIGCGVGGLHLSLLKNGAAHATGFDMSAGMIVGARKLAAEMGMQERTQYWQGDFVELHEQAPLADVTILDKVICCYENARELIARSTAKTRRVYAVSYPRDHVIARAFFKTTILLFKLFRASFHPHYHPPKQIEQWIASEGLQKTYERHTLIWVVQAFQRT